MLSLKNLSVTLQTEDEKKTILHDLSLTVKPGEVHAVMGPNGSGKSTLSHFLAGREQLSQHEGSAHFCGVSLADMPADERARKGLFLSFQHPVEIPGVSNVYLLKAALNAKRKENGEEELDAFDFLKLVKEKMKAVGLNEKFLKRSVNEGFSGGEKKRNEVLQMLLLEPKLMILDEIDSGLDVDALKDVTQCINSLRNKNRSIILVTHYQRILNDIVPDKVHILSDGTIIKSGDKSLALEVEKNGYGNFLNAHKETLHLKNVDDAV